VHVPSDDQVFAPPEESQTFPASDGSRVRWSAVIVGLVLLVGVGLLGYTWYSSSHKATVEASTPTNPGPVVMTKDQLTATVAASGHSLYWAGSRGLQSWEITIANRDVYVRYLPVGIAAGSTTLYLTVGTYEKADAYAGLVQAAAVAGAKSQKLAGGSLVVQPAGKDTSAYFAFSGKDLLMEVYDPLPGKAMQLVTSGVVQPIQ
jgi:hypothetical protein